MTEKTLEINLHLLLPEIQDERDQCIANLLALLQGKRGIAQAHLKDDHDPVDLCIHYDPNLIALSSVERLAKETGSRLRNGYRHEKIAFSGLTSADAAAVLQSELEKLPGMLHSGVNYAAGLVFAAYNTHQLDRLSIEQVMRRMGALPLPASPGEPLLPPTTEAPLPVVKTWIRDHRPLVLVAASGILLLLGWLGEAILGFPPQLSLVLYLLAIVAGGYDVAREAIPGLLRGKFDTDVLMLAAAAGAAILGEWTEGAFLLFLFSLGHAGEHYALEKARHAIGALGSLMPRSALVRQGSQWIEKRVEDVAVGEHVLVRSGDRVPVDGEIVSGSSSIDQSAITGESLPILKAAGDPVFAGTVNKESALEVNVTHLKEDTTLSRVISMVAEAQNQRSPTQQFTEKFTSVFVPGILILVVLVALLPPLFGWLSFPQSFYRAMLLLVAASPCALALGTPAAVLAGIAQAARNGVLIKGGVHLENLGRIRVIAFDKTGTLTQGKFQVTRIVTLDGSNPDEILEIAAAVERQSNHPLAQAVLTAARERNLSLPHVMEVENLPGRGLKSQIDGEDVWIGSLKQVGKQDIWEKLAVQLAHNAVVELEAEGSTTMVVARGSRLLGVIGLADTPREGAANTLSRLRGLGVKRLVMLTGDNRMAAQQTAGQTGITQVEADLLPEQKLSTIQALSAGHGPVAMVGDGVNDAPALAAATVGIAMGGAGTAVALETADVALMADDLNKLPFAVGLSRASRRIIQQNLVISLGVIVLLVLTSVLGLVELSWAVVFHEGSTILVILNALRLLGYRYD